jgi:DNA uptake protein ComE-like DNA-binding protein
MRTAGLRAALILAIICWAACTHGQDNAHRQAAASSATVPPPEQRLDINHATLDELSRVPGLSRVWAARIVRFRPYRTKEDLLDKGVVTSAVYDRIRNFVIAHRDKQPDKQVLRLR